MDYQETLDWMFARLPMYQTQGASAFRENLTNIRLLCDYLDNPQEKLKCIHVAGTNGKGSTCHLLASVFQQSGYKTGLFTSPHLKDYRERIRIDGIPVSEGFVVRFIDKHRSFFEANDLSFFEMSVGLCFAYFVERNVDIAIIETGLGGRLDATNIIRPMLSVITNIGLDHMQYLGDTLELIAREKAGIIKPVTPVIVGEYTNETKVVFERVASEKKAPIHFAQDMDLEDFPSDLLGNYQFQNKRAVLAALQIVNHQGIFQVTDAAIRKGFLSVSDSTGLLGRWQQISSNPKIIADTAHNAHGLKIVMAQLASETFENLHIVIGMVNDKDLDSVLPLFPKHAIYYFCRPDIPRGLDAGTLQAKALSFGLTGTCHASVADAFDSARNNADAHDFIYVGGSTFVVSEIL